MLIQLPNVTCWLVAGNVCLDAISSRKYYHFIRLMGRAASNITLECGLQTHPNVTLIGEEVCRITPRVALFPFIVVSDTPHACLAFVR